MVFYALTSAGPRGREVSTIPRGPADVHASERMFDPYINLAYFLWDMGKQHSPRYDTLYNYFMRKFGETVQILQKFMNLNGEEKSL